MKAIVTAHIGDVFVGGTDLTVLPCSAGRTLSREAQRWIDAFGLQTPRQLMANMRLSDLTPLVPFPGPQNITRFVAYGASVWDDPTSSEAIKKLGANIGSVTRSHPEIRIIESVLFGTSSGRLPDVIAAESLAQGFRETADPEARLWIRVHGRERHAVVQKAIESGFTRHGQQTMEKIKILFLSANPLGEKLELDREAREIEAKIRAAKHRESLELITKWAVRPDDLIQALNEHMPHVVHFSGHGSRTEEIILLDDSGNPKAVRKEALVKLFRTFRDNIRVVVLNACFSRPQAEAITGEIDCAIGMTRAISDDAAITFAGSFYRAIGFGRSVKNAFDQGNSAVAMMVGITEEQTPELMAKLNVAAESIVLINPQ